MFRVLNGCTKLTFASKIRICSFHDIQIWSLTFYQWICVIFFANLPSLVKRYSSMLEGRCDKKIMSQLQSFSHYLVITVLETLKPTTSNELCIFVSSFFHVTRAKSRGSKDLSRETFPDSCSHYNSYCQTCVVSTAKTKVYCLASFRPEFE